MRVAVGVGLGLIGLIKELFYIITGFIFGYTGNLLCVVSGPS